MTPDLTAREVAELFRCERQKVIDEAHRTGLGYNLKGRAGWRFTEADVEALRKSMAPATAPVEQRTA
jgi:hypothetical protein